MRIGVDLGGTKIEAIALDADGAILDRRRRPTPTDSYEATLVATVGLVEQLEGDLGRTGTVGVGMPGAISPITGLIKNANSTWLIGHPLHRDLSERLHREVRVANDANCFALSEAVDGAGAECHVVFGVIVGTGTGGGLAVGQRIIAGRNAIAGEWGHNPLPWPEKHELPGPACYCGRRGCIETYLSGPGLVLDYLDEATNRVDAAEIARRAAAGEANAEACLARYEERMAKSLAHVINVLDPDVIVLGGGMSNVERLYVNVPRRWGQYVFSDRVDTRLAAAVHGDSSGVRGAAWLWPEAV